MIGGLYFDTELVKRKIDYDAEQSGDCHQYGSTQLYPPVTLALHTPELPPGVVMQPSSPASL